MQTFVTEHAGVIFVILVIALLVLFGMLLLNIVQTNNLREKYEIFMKGKSGQSIEEAMGECMDEVARVERDHQQLKRYTKEVIEKKAEAGLYRHYMKRYDAFEGMGGELSFVLVLLDEHNDGYLINSVQGRDSAHVYSKNIEDGVCRQRLSPEEEQALQETLDYWKEQENV